MGEVIKCQFNLFQEGRKYTGHHRNYILESAVNTCYAPATREKLQLREALGYLGHGRRELARKLTIGEVEAIKLPDGTAILTENIPSNVTVFFEVAKDGTVNHHQEILETAPGKVVMGLNTSRVGGFSWACGGSDGGALGKTKVTDFHGFDYVMNPGFAQNRGYILESADEGLILESICRTGISEQDAEKYLRHWVGTAILENAELRERLEQFGEHTDMIREENEALQSKVALLEAAEQQRTELIRSAAQKSIIAVPASILESMLSLAGPADFQRIVGFFESAKQVNLTSLPLDVPVQSKEAPKPTGEPEYGSAHMAPTFEEVRF